jgi:hypothetical protein
MERSDKLRVADLLKILDELRMLRTRSHNQDLSRLEEQHHQAVEAAVKEAGKRGKSGSPEEVGRLQAEARKFVDAEHERTKEMLASKFTKLDQGLAALAQFLKDVGPIKEGESRLAGMEEKLRKEQDDLNIQRKVIGREQEELDRDKELIRTSQLSVKEKQKEFEAKLANLDVVKRAKELDQLREEVEAKAKAFNDAESKLEHDRQQFNLECDKMGEQRADLEKQQEALKQERAKLSRDKASMADVVAKEMALTFEAFVRDMLKPQEPQDR